MKAKRILFISQEMLPYTDESRLSKLGRELPQYSQEHGREIRTFMPKWGMINERRNQLHEVIRLSGMNIIVNDTDHPLIIKVASITQARMQVYFIDNDEFFTKRLMMRDKNGKEYTNNAERAAFFARGVLETVKKLRWIPDVIVCQGWMSSFVPMFIKLAYNEEPAFRNAKCVFMPTDEIPEKPLPEKLGDIYVYRHADKKAIEDLVDYKAGVKLFMLGCKYSDAVADCTEDACPEVKAFAQEREIPYVGSNPTFDEILELVDSIAEDTNDEIEEED